VYFDPLIVHLANDLGTGGPGPSLTAMLLDDDHDPVIPSHGAELFESLDPELAVAAAGMSKGEHLRNATRFRLADSRPEHIQTVGSLRIDPREHQERLQSQVATPFAQFLRPIGGRIAGNHRHLLSPVFNMRRPPCDEAIARRLDAAQGPKEGKLRI